MPFCTSVLQTSILLKISVTTVNTGDMKRIFLVFAILKSKYWGAVIYRHIGHLHREWPDSFDCQKSVVGN
jgi:hypothetical protein